MSEPPPELARSRTLLGIGAFRGGANYRKAARFCAWLASAILLVIFWQWYTEKFGVSPAVFPGPLQVWQSLWINLKDGTFPSDLAVTMREVLAGFFAGSLVGFFLALIISEFRPVRTIVYPYVIGLQSVPKTALAPMFLIWFGFGMESKVALVVSTVFFPVLINTLSGLERTDRTNSTCCALIAAGAGEFFCV